MARITMQDCQAVIESPFEIIKVASERARQLQDGITPAIDPEGHKPAVVALKEIAAGKLTSEGMIEEELEEPDEL